MVLVGGLGSAAGDREVPCSAQGDEQPFRVRDPRKLRGHGCGRPGEHGGLDQQPLKVRTQVVEDFAGEVGEQVLRCPPLGIQHILAPLGALQEHDQARQPAIAQPVQVLQDRFRQGPAAPRFGQPHGLFLGQAQVLPSQRCHPLMGKHGLHDRRWSLAAEEDHACVFRKHVQGFPQHAEQVSIRMSQMAVVQHQDAPWPHPLAELLEEPP